MSAPDPSELWQEVLAWLLKAETDQRAAGALLKLEPPLCDAVAFHCQQAAEKLQRSSQAESRR
jgi:HEPN domain